MIDGMLIFAAIYIFLLSKNNDGETATWYATVISALVVLLFGAGAYLTRLKEGSSSEATLNKIYESVDITYSLKEIMLQDSKKEDQVWQEEFSEQKNITQNLSPAQYSLFVVAGMVVGLTITYCIVSQLYAISTASIILFSSILLVLYLLKHAGNLASSIFQATATLIALTALHFVATIF